MQYKKKNEKIQNIKIISKDNMTDDINYHLQLLFPYHITGILLWVHD